MSTELRGNVLKVEYECSVDRYIDSLIRRRISRGSWVEVPAYTDEEIHGTRFPFTWIDEYEIKAGDIVEIIEVDKDKDRTTEFTVIEWDGELYLALTDRKDQ